MRFLYSLEFEINGSFGQLPLILCFIVIGCAFRRDVFSEHYFAKTSMLESERRTSEQ
jgi:hypothetical protein